MQFVVSTIACATAAIIAGCGGSGQSTTPPVPVTPVPPPALTTLEGIVASGAPLLNAVVTVKDAGGVMRTARAAADGNYSGLSVAGLSAPFRLEACGLVDGNTGCFYAVVAGAGTANITPLTHATVALALNAEPATMFAASGAADAPSAAALAAQQAKLKAVLADVLTKSGLQNIDFATTPFQADRSGMDKVLDLVHISTGVDAEKSTFVQLESLGGAGSVYVDKSSAATKLPVSTVADVNLQGISKVFVQGLSNAIGAPDAATCASRLISADILDPAFAMELDDAVDATAATLPAMLCAVVAKTGLLGGIAANPTLHDCDTTSAPGTTICNAGFTIVKGERSFNADTIALVLRPGSGWRLLGRDSPYSIHVGSAIQRNVRVDLPGNPQTTYNQALTFDIGARGATGATGVRAARVYQHSVDGIGWDPVPVVSMNLTDACIAAVQPGDRPRLGIVGELCGSSWRILGNSGPGMPAGSAATGDALIQNFYRRGRTVKVELYDNVNANGTPTVVFRHVNGMAPLSAALPGYAWVELEQSSKTALASYDGVSASFAVSWARNTVVGVNGMSFCLTPSCDGPGGRAAESEIASGVTSNTVTLGARPANAAAFKQVAMYGRNSEQVNVQTNYVSCGGRSVCDGMAATPARPR